MEPKEGVSKLVTETLSFLFKENSFFSVSKTCEKQLLI